MELRLVTEQAAWDAFILAHAPRSGAFLQSWAWGEFQASLQRTVRRYGWEDNGQLVAAAQTIVHPLPIAHAYAYIPRGPVVGRGWGNDDTYNALKEIASKDDATFVRFEPPWPEYPVRKRFIKTLDLQPPDTFITDLTRSRDERLAAMHSKTRYNVGLAQRKGVVVETSSDVPFAELWPIFAATAKRGGFHLHPKPYYEAMLSALAGSPCRAFLAVAKLDGKVLAANLMIDHHKTRTYLHGASGNEHRDVMAPYLLHDALMEDAAQKGMTSYDWWGIAPENASKKHAWSGVTRFKLGFGGDRVSYPGTFDAVIHPARYGLYVLARRARRLV